MQRDTRRILVFLLLTFLSSSIFYVLIARAGMASSGSALTLFLMWCPGISAILTQILFREPVKALGWRLRPFKFVGWGYLLPILYALPVYAIVWISGLGRLDLTRLPEMFAPGRGPGALVVILPILATLGVLVSLLSATGEEIGWRGFLVPMLAKRFPLWAVSLISGGIWAAWHAPLILSGDYRGSTPVWYSLVCFVAMVLAISFLFAWLRIESGSLWPAAMLHASHNLFIQQIFDPLTADTGPTAWITGEFGIGLVISALFVVTVLLARRAKTRVPQTAADPVA